MPIVTLSDGQPCKVRRLGLFELDGVGREVLGVFKYSLLLATGIITEDEYDLRALTYTPTKPDKPANEIEQGSPEWFQLQDYDTYLAALSWEKERIESYEGHINDVTTYILEHCLSPDDRNRIVEPEDWDAIQTAALVPQLTMEGVAACLRNTFYGLIWEYGDTGRAANVSEGKEQDGGAESVGD